MIVFAMDCAPETVRGELTKWLLEIKPGVFVGNINARIRDLLWERICLSSDVQGAVMVYPSNNEQGYAMKLGGIPKRQVVDMDGVQLIKVTDGNVF